MAWEIDRPFFPGGYKTIGMLRCPRCAAEREFIVPPDCHTNDANEQAAKAECCECGYAFGFRSDEKTIGPDGMYITTRHPVLDPETVSRARAKRLRKYRRDMLASGVRLEVLDGRAKSNTSNA